MTQPQDKMRAEFEAWANRHDREENLTRDGSGYRYSLAQIHWEGWQAACAQQYAQSQQDTNRIDYLQERGATVDLIIGESAGSWKFRTAGWNQSINSDIRTSIDVAIATQGASNV